MNARLDISMLASNLAFDDWWQITGEWVEAPNQRRNGQSGVLRLHGENGDIYVKRQQGHLYRSWRHPFGRPTVAREIEAYRAAARLGVRVPALVFGEIRRADGWQAVLVTRGLAGFLPLDAWYAGAGGASSLSRRWVILDAIAGQLARLHAGGWQHGCLYAKHIFVRELPDGSAEAALIDFEKAHRRLFKHRAAQRDIEQLQRHRGAMPDEDWAYLVAHYRTLLNSSRHSA